MSRHKRPSGWGHSAAGTPSTGTGWETHPALPPPPPALHPLPAPACRPRSKRADKVRSASDSVRQQAPCWQGPVSGRHSTRCRGACSSCSRARCSRQRGSARKRQLLGTTGKLVFGLDVRGSTPAEGQRVLPAAEARRCTSQAVHVIATPASELHIPSSLAPRCAQQGCQQQPDSWPSGIRSVEGERASARGWRQGQAVGRRQQAAGPGSGQAAAGGGGRRRQAPQVE